MMWKAKQVCVSVVVFGALLAGIPRARAQNEQQESVADAARKTRDQKKEAAKPARVITNDTLEPPKAEAPAPSTTPAATPAATVTTETNQATSLSAAPGGDQQAAGPAASETSEKTTPKDRRLEALKQEIKQLQSEVDLAQRELALANDKFYSRPDFSKDDEGKAKLDAMKSDLAQKQGELAQLRTQLPAGADVKEEKPAQSDTGSQSQSQPAPQQR